MGRFFFSWLKSYDHPGSMEKPCQEMNSVASKITIITFLRGFPHLNLHLVLLLGGKPQPTVYHTYSNQPGPPDTGLTCQTQGQKEREISSIHKNPIVPNSKHSRCLVLSAFTPLTLNCAFILFSFHPYLGKMDPI